MRFYLFVAETSIIVELVHFFLGGEVCNEHLVTHSTGQRIGNAAPHDHLVTVLHHDVVVTHLVVLAITAAAEAAEAAEKEKPCRRCLFLGGERSDISCTGRGRLFRESDNSFTVTVYTIFCSLT